MYNVLDEDIIFDRPSISTHLFMSPLKHIPLKLLQPSNAESSIESPEVITTVCKLFFGIYEMARAGQVTLVKLGQL